MGLRAEPEQLAWNQLQCTHLRVDQDTPKPGHPITFCVAELEGTAVIGDPAALGAGIRAGIGHALILGLGAFTVAPA